MRSYIKVYGPPTLKALKALEALAINYPRVCIMDTVISTGLSTFKKPEEVANFFGDITIQRCRDIISEGVESLGEYDFFFEWFDDPTMDHLNDLIEKVDGVLKPLKCRYTITTKP